MIYTSENNWYKWFYDGEPFSKQENDKIFSTSFSCKYDINSTKNFKQEIISANKSIIDHYNNIRPTLLFSGGADSEIILRGFLEIGIVPNIHIYRYENDYNLYDVSYAVSICSSFDVDYTLIDFNLQKFFENEAEHISEVSQIDRPRALPYCKFLNNVDELPILGASDLTIYRKNNDYSILGEWIVRCWEHDIAWSKYLRTLNKPGIAEWFKWTPGLVASFSQTTWCQNLICDKYCHKLGTNSTKLYGYREAFPDMIARNKKTGFEKINFIVEEFENYLKKKNNGLKYRQFFDRPFSKLLIELQE